LPITRLEAKALLDQTFTTENFRRVFDLETRKGANLEERFFPQLEGFTSQIRVINEGIRLLRRQRANLSVDSYNSQLTVLRSTHESLKVAKEDALRAALEAMGEQIRSTGFRVGLTKSAGPGGKDVYPVSDSVCAYFIVKHLQRNLSKLYKVKQSDRHQQVNRVKDALNSGYPFVVVRTDIKSFYESVDRTKLSRKLNEDHLLSLSSKRYIRQILDSFGNLSGSSTGIPRGVGVSAYLGELYLRPVDRQIQQITGLVVYARYVDDIIAIFAPPPEGTQICYESAVRQAINDQNLAINDEKTKTFTVGSDPVKFEYLGYRFWSSTKGCKLSISSAKALKYKNRLEAAFREYRKASAVHTRSAHRLLVQRIRFITGNTRLLNNKSQAVTGVFYNNSAADDLRTFDLLDRRLSRLVAAVLSPTLRKRLASAGFRRGFEGRRFHTYSTRRLKAIVEAWANAS
jgi:hypothetical protein